MSSPNTQTPPSALLQLLWAPLHAAGTSWVLPEGVGAANCRLTCFCPGCAGLSDPLPLIRIDTGCVKYWPRARGRAAGDGRTTRHSQRR
jgi:hypothetical protein